MTKLRLLSVLTLAAGVLGQTCPDTTPDKHYPLPGTTLTAGLPAGGAKLGSALSTCELYELQKYCISKINTYRTGTVKFGDGRAAPFTAKTPLTNPDTPMLQCLNQKAVSDLIYANSGKGCGHYTSSLDCGLGVGGGAENSCCPRSCSSLTTCKATLDGCLKQMWDEGQIVLDTGSNAWTMATGHYWNMIGDYKHAVCGFGFDSKGGMLATQNFFGSGATAKPCTYNCSTATSQATQCGKCFGVSYCTVNTDCKTPPICYTAPGTCTNGQCTYTTQATTCLAGICSAGKCVQTCADPNCAYCTAFIAGTCQTCKAGFSLVSGSCIDDSCVVVSGLSQSGTYKQVGTNNGMPSYQLQTNPAFFLTMYCCGWGWAITNSATGGSAYSKSDVTTGTAVQSSGKWSAGAGITIKPCSGGVTAPTAVISPTPRPTARPTKQPTAPTNKPPTSPTPKPATTPTALAWPSDAVLKGTCTNGGLQDCKGMCWTTFATVKSALGNKKCGDWADMGLDLNCARLKCDMGDCICPIALEEGDVEQEPVAFGMLEDSMPLAPPVEGNGDSSGASSLFTTQQAVVVLFVLAMATL